MKLHRTQALFSLLLLNICAGCSWFSLSARFRAQADELGQLDARLSVASRELEMLRSLRDGLGTPANPATDRDALAKADADVQRLSGVVAELEASIILVKNDMTHTQNLMREQERNSIRASRAR